MRGPGQGLRACWLQLLLLLCVLCAHFGRASVVLEWAAPFLSGGGYCSEAFAFIHALTSTGFTSTNAIKAVQHGDSYNPQFVANMRSNESSFFKKLNQNPPSTFSNSNKISICHSEPGAWSAPFPNYHTQSCPPRDATYRIGRTMFETDRIPSGWVSRLAYMDEIWVPTEAAKKAFLVGGAPLNKLTVVPEPVDTYFYSNRISQDSEIDNSSKKRTIFKTMTQWQLSPSHPPIVSSETFVFLFVGKFEYRKGIHLLLKAFYEEFFSHLNNEEDLEDVLLCILTSAYHSTSDFFGEVERFLLEEQIVQSVPLETFLSKIILYTDVPQIQMPLLYSTANVLVIPSRGEGWGRPHVEAMACETPIIATNWSGPTAYLTENNGFPLKYGESLVAARGWEGHFWAEPSLSHLRELLRFTVSHPEVVREKGREARRTMETLFSYSTIGLLVSSHIDRIEKKLLSLEQEQKRVQEIERGIHSGRIATSSREDL